jgi:hypothetical protein
MPSIKKFSKKSLKKRQNITKNKKQSGGAAMIPIPIQTPDEMEKLYEKIINDITFGYDPFVETGLITLQESKYNEKHEHIKSEIKYKNVDDFKTWTNKNDKTFSLMQTACLKGYSDSLISLIDLYYPNNTIPEQILYKLYIFSMFWEYGRTNNPVRIYLATFYNAKLNIQITAEMRDSFTYLDKSTKDTIFKEGANLLEIFNFSLLDNNYKSYHNKPTYNKPKKNNKSNKNNLSSEIETLITAGTIQELKKAYKKLALKYHPDKNRGKVEESLLKFTTLTNRYTELISKFT